MLHVEPVESQEWSLPEITSVCNENGISLLAEQASLLTAYVESLRRWNQKINLVSRMDMKRIWVSHILHSITPFMRFFFSNGLKVVDIGTGGGLPGVPFAILRPDFQVTMIDSIRKKTDALEAIIREIGLHNARVVNGRVEALGKSNEFRHHFDLGLSRGVSSLSTLTDWAGPLLTKRRVPSSSQAGPKKEIPLPAILAFKGGDVSSEVSDAIKKRLGISIEVNDIRFEGIMKPEIVEKKLVVIHMQGHS